jgi:vitamin B12 transporter
MIDKEDSSFFEKKDAKKLLPVGRRGPHRKGPRVPGAKVFWFFFSKKNSFFLWFFCFGGAFADPVVTENIDVTETRAPLTADATSVVSSETITAADDTTLADALSAVPGARMVQAGPPGGVGTLFLRGANSEQTLALRDGVPINDASNPSAAFDFGIDDLGDVDHIDIIEGPLATTYGSGAIGGVVNIISKQATEDGTHVSATLQGGYPGAILADGTLTEKIGRFTAALTLETQSLDNYDPTPPRMSIYTNTPEGYRAQTATLNLGLAATDWLQIFALARGRDSNFGFNNLGYPTYDADNSSGTANQYFARVGATLTPWQALTTTLSLSYQTDNRTYIESLAAADPNQATTNAKYQGSNADAQINNALDLTGYLPLRRALITFGYQHDAARAQSVYDSTSFGYPYSSNGTGAEHTDAFYLGALAAQGPLTLSGQVRHDKTSDAGAATTFNAGADIALPENLTAHAAYGTAFRAPSLFDRYGTDSYGFFGNPNLHPESAHEFEAGLTWHPMQGTSVRTTYFDNRIHGLIDYVYLPTSYTVENIGHVRADGVETAITTRVLPTLNLIATYTYTDARDLDSGQLLLRRPYDEASLAADWHVTPALRLRPQIMYTGRDLDYIYNDQGLGVGDGSNRPGFLANITASYQVQRDVSVFANVRNLTDSHYEPANGYRVAPTSVLFGVRVAL